MSGSFYMATGLEMSILPWSYMIPLKSRNHLNFSAPNKCRFLFKPIIFEYSFKQSELLYNMAYLQSII